MATINEDILRKKFGFNDPNVIAGILSDPGQVARYEKEYAGVTGGGGATSSASAVSFDPVQEAQRLLQFQREANKPVIQQLESEKPTLQSRYQQIINDIKGSKEKLLGESDVGIATEFGKRGIPTSSGVVGQAQLKGRTGIETSFGQLETEAGAGLESAMNEINRIIAQAQAGDSQGALQTALNMLNLRQNQQQFEATKSLRETESAESTRQFEETLGEEKRQFNISANKPREGTQAERLRSQYLGDLTNAVKSGATLSDVAFRFQDELSVSDILGTYDKYNIYGPRMEASSERLNEIFGF